MWNCATFLETVQHFWIRINGYQLFESSIFINCNNSSIEKSISRSANNSWVPFPTWGQLRKWRFKHDVLPLEGSYDIIWYSLYYMGAINAETLPKIYKQANPCLTSEQHNCNLVRGGKHMVRIHHCIWPLRKQTKRAITFLWLHSDFFELDLQMKNSNLLSLHLRHFSRRLWFHFSIFCDLETKRI